MAVLELDIGGRRQRAEPGRHGGRGRQRRRRRRMAAPLDLGAEVLDASRQDTEPLGDLALLPEPLAVLDRQPLLKVKRQVLVAARQGRQTVADREHEGVEEVQERAVELDLAGEDQIDVGPRGAPEELLPGDDGGADPGAVGGDDRLGGRVPVVVQALEVLFQLVLKCGRALRELDLHLRDAPDLVLGVEAGGPALAHARLDLLHEPAGVDAAVDRAGRDLRGGTVARRRHAPSPAPGWNRHRWESRATPVSRTRERTAKA